MTNNEGSATLVSLRSAYAGRVWTEPGEMAPFLSDWRGKWKGPALAVAQPANTDEVAQLLAWCHAHGVAV
ncbi:MAG: hydroxyacid dehydrogenase, partial [Burkholderiaceae bacterium]|nr:hydroxyacid dehydrogenase [Burkholderiaceae bacterium]